MATGDKFAGQLDTADAALVEALGKALFVAGQTIQVAAQLSITRGAVSGKGHVPSAPGEPPKNDTGVLANSIETTQPEPLRVEVSSNAPYAAVLEYGTTKMAARPYMQPAVAQSRPDVEKLIGSAVSIAVRRHFGK